MVQEMIAIGSGCIDHLSIVTRTVDGWEQCGVPLVQGGGLASTGATAIARLGGGVELWGIVGDDYHGQMIRTELERDGVDISQMPVVPGYRSPCSYIEVDAETGERTIYGSGFDRRPENVSSYFDPKRAREAKAMLVTGFVPDVAYRGSTPPACKRRQGCRRSARIDGPVSEMIRHVDAPIMPEFAVEPLVALTCAAALRSWSTWARRCRPYRAAGFVLPADGVVYHCPAFTVKVIDTTRLRRLVPRRVYLCHGHGL